MTYQKIQHTNRGLGIFEFIDRYGAKCNVQESSIATEASLWVGVENADPKILHSDATRLGVQHNATGGWVSYPIPDEVLLNTRMHLTQEQALQLGKLLLQFAESGELPRTTELI